MCVVLDAPAAFLAAISENHVLRHEGFVVVLPSRQRLFSLVYLYEYAPSSPWNGIVVVRREVEAKKKAAGESVSGHVP